MPRDEETLQWVEIEFGHGIWTDQQVIVGHGGVPDGAAIADTTYNCFSPEAGGLAPLPGQHTVVSGTLADYYDNTTQTSHRPADSNDAHGNGRVWLGDGAVIGPVRSSGGSTLDVPDVIQTIHHWRYSPTGGGVGTYGPAHAVRSEAISSGYSPRNLDETSTATSDGLLRTGPSFIAETVGLAGGRYVPVAVHCVRTNQWSGNHGRYVTFPDQTTPTGGTAYAVDWNNAAINVANRFIHGMVAHQGRLIVMARPNYTTYGFGPDVEMMGGEELWYNSEFNTQSVFTGPTLAGEDNYSGYGAWCSMNANELLLVKHRVGGVLIRGDIANPTVLRLPGIEGVRGLANIACNTPHGVIYGSHTGIHLWAGNDRSELISPQHDHNFWAYRNWTGATLGIDADGVNRYGAPVVGRFAYASPFVYAPNGYVLDLEHSRKPWWRMRATTGGTVEQQIHHWDVGTEGVWGFHEYIDSSYTRVATYFHPSTPATSYSWKSFPLSPTRGRYATVREFAITVSGNLNDAVTVQFTGEEGTAGSGTTATTTITLAANGTERHRYEVHCVGRNISVLVTGTAASTGAAPRVHDLVIGVIPGPKLNT